MTSAALVGGSAELRRLAGLIGGVSGGASCVVVSGDPGIGRSALLNEAARLAVDQGMRVLQAAGLEPETWLRFAGQLVCCQASDSRFWRTPRLSAAQQFP